MYFCEKCRAKNHWPIGILSSHGACKVCGEIADCYDKAVSSLPSSLEEAMERERISAINEAEWGKEKKRKAKEDRGSYQREPSLWKSHT